MFLSTILKDIIVSIFLKHIYLNLEELSFSFSSSPGVGVQWSSRVPSSSGFSMVNPMYVELTLLLFLG